MALRVVKMMSDDTAQELSRLSLLLLIKYAAFIATKGDIKLKPGTKTPLYELVVSCLFS